MKNMDHETNHQTNHQFRRLPKGERRVRFADSMGMELVSIFLFDLISNYYFASIHHDKKLPPPPPSSSSPTSQISHPLVSTRTSTQTTPSISNTTSSIHSSATRVDQSKASSYNTNNKVQVACQPDASNQSFHQISQQQQQQQQHYQKQLSQVSQQHYHLAYQQHYFHHHHPHQPQQQQHQQQQQSQQLHQQHQQAHHHHKPLHPPQFICQFTQPISLISFKERVKLNKVHLETCTIQSGAGNLSVSCTIRVLNQSYDKSVIVRYTTDEWHSFTDSLASYRPGSCDGWSDKFTSTFSVGNQVKESQTGQRIMFAIKYTYDGNKVCWDNNGGLNYTIKKVS